MQIPRSASFEAVLENLDQIGRGREAVAHDLECHFHADRFGHPVNLRNAAESRLAMVVIRSGIQAAGTPR